jgi:hypothetical protein
VQASRKRIADLEHLLSLHDDSLESTPMAFFSFGMMCLALYGLFLSLMAASILGAIFVSLRTWQCVYHVRFALLQGLWRRVLRILRAP